ncbi:MAG: TetR/AcrR family transcriptional regulator [Microthrixaceae bacterium]
MQEPVHETTRRRLSARQAATVDRLVSAALDALRDSGYDGLTIRGVAASAGVAPATAYTYFSSREHLVTELFWRRLMEMDDPLVDQRRSAARRAADAMVELALVVADEPELSAACTQAMLSTDEEVALLRDRIGAQWHRRLTTALAQDADPVVLRSLEIAISGALLQTGMGHLSYELLPELLSDLAQLIVSGARTTEHEPTKGERR